MKNVTPVPEYSQASTTDRILIILCHLSTFLSVPLLLPLIVFLVSRNDPTPVPAHAREALNFHISLAIYGLCCIPLAIIGIGFLLGIVLGGALIVLSIVAAVKASKGEFYRYPYILRLVPA